MKIVPIPPDSLTNAWPLVRQWITDACGKSAGRFSEQSVFDLVLSGAFVLWLVWDEDSKQARAVVVTEILTYPTGLKAGNIVMCLGEGRKDWLFLLDDLEQWAKAEGCDVMQVWARKGWAKELSDYRMSHVFLERVL